MRDSLLAEFDQEMAVTRRVLERAPEAAFTWKPHEKSFSLGGLATHLAQLPRWGSHILSHAFYDLATSSGRHAEQTTVAGVLAAFDENVSDVRRALVAQSDAELASTWSLKRGTHTVLSMPRIAAIRSFLIHHVIHHRGQMTVYLRLQGVPLPPIYGPTADERM
ncbi:MAG: DinB family protein [Acidobacteriota bacterium]